MIRTHPYFQRTAQALFSLAICVVMVFVGVPVKSRLLNQTVITIGFDDGFSDQFAALPILASHKMHATFYIIGGDVGTPGYLNWDQLSALYAAGNEIGGHSLTHQDLTKISEDEARHEVCQGRNVLLAHGLAQISFAYPYGAQNQSVEKIVKDCGYSNGRSVNGRSEIIPPKDPYSIRITMTIQKDTRPEDVINSIKEAQYGGGKWLQLLFHHICERCDPYSMSAQDFSNLLDRLASHSAKEILIDTTGQVTGGSHSR